MRLAARIDRAALDHAIDMIAIGNRALQRLEHKRTHGLAIHKAIGIGGKWLALVVARQHGQCRQTDHVIRRNEQIYPAGNSHFAVAAAQAFDRQMHRRQRRRAGGIDRHAGTLEVEQIGNAVGDRPEAYAGGVALIQDADECADLSALAQALRRIAGVFDTRVDLLHEQPFLRADQSRFARRDVEEQSIEAIGVIEQAGPFAIGLAGLLLLFVENQAVVPAFQWYFGDAATSRDKVVPELIDVGSTGVTPGKPDDRDVEPCGGRRSTCLHRTGPFPTACAAELLRRHRCRYRH
ncbi:hypothetical protein DYGSA30_32620 [Dyella sp. GSA-30]|nr:hypothetical protein DYGSA30_32620 [Dyella sp. GSA-30]